MLYLDFLAALSITLTPAQFEFARVGFDGGEPCECAECAKLWGVVSGKWSGPLTRAPAAARRVVAAVCGRGSGKSLLGGTRALHLAMTVDLSKLAKGERAEIPVIAPDLETAEQVVRFALGAAEQIGLRISQRVKGGDRGFSIDREGGRKVHIVARSASAKGRTVRGRSFPAVVMDEACFFYDASHRVNDQDIFDAAVKRLMKGGQLIILSSPWTESGLLFDLWKRNFGKPFDALVAHAPTDLMRSDDPDVLEIIAMERTVDPEKCKRERDACFMTANAYAFFDSRSVALAFQAFDPENIKGATRAVGGDFAFTRNSTAFVASQLHEGRYDVIDLYERRPGDEPLKPTEVCKDGVEFAKAAEVDEIVADGHYRETVVEELGRGGIVYAAAPEGASGKADVFQTLRSLLHEGLVRVPTEINGSPQLSEKLRRQLNEVTSRPLPGGGMRIDSPLWRTGEHGDLVSAFALSMWRVYKLGWTPDVRSEFAIAAERAGIDDLERACMEMAESEDEKRGRIRQRLGLFGMS